MSCSPSKTEYSEGIPPRWTSSDNGHYSVWFQDWSDYTRLVIINSQDTLKIEPSKYAVRTQNKPYLYPKGFDLVTKKQMIGNIEWSESPKWDNEIVNSFIWKVDRANPKINLPKILNGNGSIIDGELHLNVFDNSNQLFSVTLRPLTIY